MKKEIENKDITRKEAIKKMGKYAALTAVGTFAVLSPLRAQDKSNPLNPGNSAASEQTLEITPTEEATPSSSRSNGNGYGRGNGNGHGYGHEKNKHN
ncbi:hypothetical protein [Formosa haliotis]|uniref:hypothetical protein n=1 Tax=Formosa haliotis TaxID=1555194 RepID=UPI000824754B|nr:hypothetical protein [Formosa haliotis]